MIYKLLKYSCFVFFRQKLVILKLEVVKMQIIMGISCAEKNTLDLT
jgi:hypothetical protein